MESVGNRWCSGRAKCRVARPYRPVAQRRIGGLNRPIIPPNIRVLRGPGHAPNGPIRGRNSHLEPVGNRYGEGLGFTASKGLVTESEFGMTLDRVRRDYDDLNRSARTKDDPIMFAARIGK